MALSVFYNIRRVSSAKFNVFVHFFSWVVVVSLKTILLLCYFCRVEDDKIFLATGVFTPAWF